MKKMQLIILSVFLLLIHQANAQDDAPVSLGIKAGANYSTLIRDSQNLSSEYRLGYVAGPFLRINVSNVYIQPEVLFSSKNTYLRNTTVSDGSNPGDPVNSSTTVRINSVDIPLLLGIKLVNTDQFNLRLQGGPLASVILDTDGLEEIADSETPVKELYNRSVWGYQAGIGMDFGNLTFDVVYEAGLNETYDLTRYNLGKPKTGLFQFTVGVKFF